PSDNSHTDVDVTISGRELFCGGLSFLSDGHLFVTGGHVEASNNIGTTYTTVFDPTSSTWSDGPVMAYARWYPTNLQMADGRSSATAWMDRSFSFRELPHRRSWWRVVRKRPQPERSSPTPPRSSTWPARNPNGATPDPWRLGGSTSTWCCCRMERCWQLVAAQE